MSDMSFRTSEDGHAALAHNELGSRDAASDAFAMGPDRDSGQSLTAATEARPTTSAIVQRMIAEEVLPRLLQRVRTS